MRTALGPGCLRNRLDGRGRGRVELLKVDGTEREEVESCSGVEKEGESSKVVSAK